MNLFFWQISTATFTLLIIATQSLFVNGSDFNSSFTRFHKKTKSFTLIDGILLSRNLLTSVDNVRIPDYGENVSNHLSVELDLHVTIVESQVRKPSVQPYVNWSKLSEEQLFVFRQEMSRYLGEIDFLSMPICHGNHICEDDHHKADIELFYDRIVLVILRAESSVPKTNPAIHRSFWTSELSTLKQASIDCTRYWKSIGSPTTGSIYNCKKDCQFKYKIALRNCKKEDEKKRTDDMFINLLDRGI